MPKVSIKLFFNLICTNPRIFIRLWGIALLLCKRNCLAFRNLGELVSIWARVMFDCNISYLWSLSFEVDDISASFWKEGIIFIRTWKLLKILVFWNLDDNSYSFALLEIILYFIELSWWSAHNLMRAITFSKRVLCSSQISSYVIFSNVRILPLLAVRSRSITNAKRSLRPSLWENYLLNAFRSMIVGL